MEFSCVTIDLNGEWQFKCDGWDGYKTAEVPGCNYTDLMRLGLIPDPFYGTNENDVGWVSKTDWTYKKTFTADENLLSRDSVTLVADQLDTICQLYLNGTPIGRGENCHIAYRFDIKDKLKLGENELIIRFDSPVNYVFDANRAVKATPNANGQRGVSHIRKPQCHFGWDWGPVLPLSGCTGAVKIEGRDKARIDSVQTKQAHNADGSVTLSIVCAVEMYKPCNLSLSVKALSPTNEVITFTPLDDGLSAMATIQNPQLWQTSELSEKQMQPLYSVSVTLMCDGVSTDGKTVRVGLRTIKLLQDFDAYGKDCCIELNGNRVFCKGANLIPPDSFMPRFKKEDWRKLLSSAAFANMNILRVWGGGYYGQDEFYDLCDELGILVWQDFAFACQAYPFFLPQFSVLVKSEVDSVVKRLRNHPSLAIWCGNNEIECMTSMWLNMLKYIKATRAYFYDALPEQLKNLDDRPYIVGSPYGIDFLKGVDADNVGDAHIWAVWHGMQDPSYFNRRFPRFCSEYGFESLPSKKTVRAYGADPSDNLSSNVPTAHQKCRAGNDIMRYYAVSRFNFPSDNADFVYISQLCQEECVRSAAEHFRRNKGRCNGVMYWQLNDCWPCSSWSSVDFFGRYKALHYSARRFFSPLAVSIEDNGNSVGVYTLNDTSNNAAVTVEARICRYDGTELAVKTVNAVSAAGESKKQLDLDLSFLKRNKRTAAYVVAILKTADKEISRSTMLLSKEKYASLPVPKIVKTVEPVDGKLKITLTSDVYARLAALENAFFDAPFSDNFFDLLPNEPKTVWQTLDENQKVGSFANSYSDKELAYSISVVTVASVAAKGGVKDTLTRFRIFFKPMNFLSYIFYSAKNTSVHLKKN